MFGTLFDLGAGLVGAALNYKGAKKANEMNKKIAREQMDFQHVSTQDQMHFQERMSNTAYQRAVQDMREAGINPIMAFSQGGASTPSGSSASGASTHVSNAVSKSVSSALDFKRTLAEVRNLEQQNKLLKATTAKTTAEGILEASKVPGAKIQAILDESPAGWIQRILTMARKVVLPY